MNKLITWTVVLLFAATVNLPISAQKVIPFADGASVEKEVLLSTIASSVDYIPLETKPESLLGTDILDVTFAGGYLFVCDYMNLFQFTPEGKFIRKIGKAGQGPGEYKKSIMGITYDEARKQVLLSDSRAGKVLFYSFDGKFIREIKTASGSETPCIDVSGNLYTITNNYLYSKDRSGKELFVYNNEGKLLYDFDFNFIEGKRYPTLIFNKAVLYNYKGDIYYKNPLETTIYRLEGKKKVPVYTLDLSQYEKLNYEDDAILVFDKEKNIGTNLPNKAAEKKFYFFNLLETDHFLGIYYSQESRRFAWYDKQSGKVVRVRASGTEADGFTDDLEGGLPFCPRESQNDQILNVVTAAALIEKVKPSATKGSLKRLMGDLQEDDNQIVCVVTLK